MRIIEVNKYGDFSALEETWKNVLERCSQHTVFSTWEWLTTWWKHFGRDKKLLVLLAEEDGEIVGIAPLMYSVHRTFGLRHSRIEFIGTRELTSGRFIGTPDSDYNNFILTKKSQGCVKLFIDYLNSLPEKWVCIDLMDIPEDAKSLLGLQELSKSLKPIHECPYTLLPESYEKFLMHLSRNQRKNIYRTSRRAQEAFEVEFVDCSGIQSFHSGMECLFDLHQKRWESRGFPGIFADEKVRAFNLDIAKTFSDRKWLCLFLMNLSGKPVAAAYGFKYQSKFYEYCTGLDPMYFKYNVGNLLRAHMIGELIHEGIAEFDFMRGAEEYKDRWNTSARWNQRAVIPRKSLLGDLRTWLYEEYWRQGNRLKYVLKIKR